MRQTSRRERTRKLANRDLDLSHIDLLAQSPLDFIDRCGLEEQREGGRTQQFTYLKGEDSPCLKRWRTLVLR